MVTSLISRCRVCRSDKLNLVLSLDSMPGIAQYFPTEQSKSLTLNVDLKIATCLSCGQLQLMNKPVSYYREVIRSNSVSGSLYEYRVSQLSNFIDRFNLWDSSIVEFGSGDGDIIHILRELDTNYLGIEGNVKSVQTLQANGFRAVSYGIDQYPDKINGSPFDCFLSFNVLEHAPDPLHYLGSIRRNLSDSAVGLIEVPNLDMILRENMLSEFMLEHLTYFNRDSFQRVLELSGFEVITMNETWHDYSLSAEIKVRNSLDLNAMQRIWSDLKSEVHTFLATFPSGSVCVWGAGHQSLATIELLEISDWLNFLVDSSPKKQNRFCPGSGIPICTPEVLKDENTIRVILVLGGSYTNEIISNLILNFPPHYSILIIENSKLKVVR